MAKALPRDPRRVLDETAHSILELVRTLESREMQGLQISATEIHNMASRLQGYVENLIAASKSLRDEKSEN
jgi:hypothetical protein